MRHFRIFYALVVLITLFSACKKESVVPPTKPGNPSKPDTTRPGNPETYLVIKVKGSIAVGDVVYDSIPATLTITSWDSNQVQHVREQALAAGFNNVSLPKSHRKFELKLSQWGVSEKKTFNRDEVAEGTSFTLGGAKAPKKLRQEETFLLVEGAYQPSGKAIYFYNGNSTLNRVEYFQKKPQYYELVRTIIDEYVYSGSIVERINRRDGSGASFGFIDFTYDGAGKVVNMHQKSYDQETFAAVEYGASAGFNEITIDYLYSNGHAMEYKMKFRGGNKVQDVATTSTGAGEGGTYGYDLGVNPYAHMNMPNIYLSNLSKNNIVAEQKGYGNSVPSAVPYKFEYQYDGDGYPVQLITHYKSHVTGQYLYQTKKLFTY